MLADQAYLAIYYALKKPKTLDLTSLPLSDRMWMAHMFTYHLHKDGNDPECVSFVVDFIGICLDLKSPARLVADCVLLAGLLLGVQIGRRHLARLDKGYPGLAVP